MREPGFYFMDRYCYLIPRYLVILLFTLLFLSPGNDIESIAGQVASGATMIFFITGNGSITNHPFVPTIKIVTTTGRYNLLSRDMDVNAGAYLGNFGGSKYYLFFNIIISLQRWYTYG